MNAFIEDGVGSGGVAAVIGNELQVTTETEAMKANIRGDAYTIIADSVDPGGAAEDWFYMMNNDSRNLIIYRIDGWCVSTDEEFNVLLGATDAGTDAGDVITPVNNNAGSGKLPRIECTSDATNLAITGGDLVTTLKFDHVTLQHTTHLFPSGIILAPNTRLHMEAKGAGIVHMNLYFYMD